MINFFRVSPLIAMTLMVSASTLVAADPQKLVGSIESLPQTAPLQLKVSTREGNRLIQCAEETAIKRGSKKVDRDSLKKGMQIVVVGKAKEDLLVASEIELVDVIDGKIEAIMEIFPLRLSVKTDKDNCTVQLKKETRVFRGKTEVDAGKLRNGDTVRIVGTFRDSTLFAEEIDQIP